MEILKTVGRAVRKGLEALEREDAPPPAPDAPSPAVREIDPRDRRIADLELALAFYTRRAQEYFECVRDFERQRDQWRELFKRDASGHQQAQAMLQEAVIRARTQIAGAATLLNRYRQDKGEPPIVSVADLEKAIHEPPVGVAEATKADLDAAVALLPAPTTAEAAVAAIDEKVPVPEGVIDVSHDPATRVSI